MRAWSKLREFWKAAVNSGLTVLYWNLGQRIRREVLREKRVEYGERIVSALETQLEGEFGRGFGEKNLHRMIQFAEAFPDREIVVSLLRQLGWTHFLRLIPIDDPLKRDFYAEMCRMENWNTRTVHQKIQSMIELKARKFQPGDGAQLGMYVTAVDRLLCHPDDKPTWDCCWCASRTACWSSTPSVATPNPSAWPNRTRGSPMPCPKNSRPACQPSSRSRRS